SNELFELTDFTELTADDHAAEAFAGIEFDNIAAIADVGVLVFGEGGRNREAWVQVTVTVEVGEFLHGAVAHEDVAARGLSTAVDGEEVASVLEVGRPARHRSSTVTSLFASDFGGEVLNAGDQSDLGVRAIVLTRAVGGSFRQERTSNQ